MIMASKVWDDLSMWNADFSQVCGSFTLKRINELELALLEFLGFSVKVTASDYAKYYFHLRSYSCRLGLIHDLKSLAPLDMGSAHKLSVLSANYESTAKVEERKKRRPASMPDGASMRASTAGSGAGAAGSKSLASLEQLVAPKHKQAGETGST